MQTVGAMNSSNNGHIATSAPNVSYSPPTVVGAGPRTVVTLHFNDFHNRMEAMSGYQHAICDQWQNGKGGHGILAVLTTPALQAEPVQCWCCYASCSRSFS